MTMSLTTGEVAGRAATFLGIILLAAFWTYLETRNAPDELTDEHEDELL